jgi:DNA-directed RNA polymerase specialized sigma subunit
VRSAGRASWRGPACSYARSPEPSEDLIQVGYVGLLKAIINFDLALWLQPATHAGPCAIDELSADEARAQLDTGVN